MSDTGPSPTQELAEFLAVVSSHKDPTVAMRAAVEQAALALDAEVGAVVRQGVAVSSVGFPVGSVPHAELAAVAEGAATWVDVPGPGRCDAISAPLGGTPEGHLVLARTLDGGFTLDEVHLVRAMARVLELTLETLRTLSAEQKLREHSDRQAKENAVLLRSLRERQRLLEHLSRVQRAISTRTPLQQVLDLIVESTRDLLGADVVTLRLIDPEDASHILLSASDGLREELATRIWRLPVANAGAAGRAIQRNEIVVERYDEGEQASEEVASEAVRLAMAAPVHDNGAVVGSLTVATRRSGQNYLAAECAVLQAFAEHVTLAVTDARTLEAMYQAFHDSLTGLASRALFLDRLQHGLSGAARSLTTVGLLFIDLDRFKMVNDTLGHSAGDLLLVEVAERVRGCLRVSDTAARFGGDEFAVLLQGTSDKGAAIVADRIIEAVRAPYTISGREIFVDASIGIALSDPTLMDAHELLRAADVAMYQAKRNGKGRHEIFEPSMHSALMERLELEADLRRAIDGHEFVLHYQPIVALDSGRVIAVEALLRWDHPRRGLVSPLDFIPFAEETGLILPLGQWVMEQACKQAKSWQEERPTDPPLAVSVNLSARQLEQRDVAERVAEALVASGLDPSCLVLEITETLLLEDAAETVERLSELRQVGVRVAIDDFGTGYSSLSYLRQFPVDILKIDKSFVDGIGSGAEESAFARAIVRLGQTLHLEMIAEGIEHAGQVDELRKARCQLGQGYFYSRPVPADQISVLLAGTDTDRLDGTLPVLPAQPELSASPAESVALEATG